MKNEIEHILFDLGGVLLNIDLAKISTGFLEIMDQSAEGWRKVKFEIIPSYEIGEITTDEFLCLLSPYLRPGYNQADIEQIWNSIILDMPIERLEMLMVLRSHFKVHLLSNINDLHARCFESKFRSWYHNDPRAYFDGYFYSHEIGKRKPDVSTFSWVIQQINGDPSKAMFIDDMPENIEGARNAGMQAQQLLNNKMDVVELISELGLLEG